jgi:Ca2+-binding RTX toxin-like protein
MIVMAGLFAREGGEFIANSTTFDDQRRPTVAKLANGNFVVIWDDISRAAGGPDDIESVRGQLFSPAGVPIGGEFLVNTAIYHSQTASRVAALGNGGFVVTWTDYSYEGGDDQSSSVKAQMFDSAGARIGGETLVNTTVPGYQMSSAVSGLPGGGYVAVWVDVQGLLSLQGNIRGQRFDSTGAKVGGEFTVNSLADNRQTSPTVTTLADGRFVVTWTDGTPGTLDGSGHSVRGQMFNSDGSRIGSEFQVNQSAYANQHSQSVTALAGGGFVAIWVDQQGFPGSDLFEAGGSALEAQIFDSDGNRVGGEFVLNPVRRTTASGATVAAMADGTFVVSWNDFGYRDNDEVWNHIAAQAFDARGNRLGDQFYLETHRSAHDQTALAALDGGRFVAVWHSGAGSAFHNNYPGDIRAQIFAPARGVLDIALSNSGLSETQPNNLQIGTILPTAEAVNARVTYQIVADSTGGGFRIEGDRIVVADNSRLDYESGATVTLTIRAFDGAGGHYDEVVQLTLADAAIERRWAATEEVQVNTTISWDQEDPAVAAVAGGGHVVVWEDPDSGGDRYGPSIKAQMYDPAGARVGLEFRVNGPMGGQQFDPAAASLAGGGFVVTWTELDPGGAEGTSVKAKIFDSAGRPVAGELGEFFVQADPGQGGNQGSSAVTGLASGGLAAAWYDPAADGSGGGIKARLFTAAGEAVGGELLVNSGAGGEQNQPAIASLASGGFVVTWTDAGGSADSAGRADSSGTGIKGRLFDSAGRAVGGEFLANSMAEGDQSGSAVTGLAGGGFVVAWIHPGAGGRETRAQLFDASGAKTGAEIVLPGGGLGPAVTALPDGGFILALQSDGGAGRDPVAITAQQFDSAGNRVGSQWLVNEVAPGDQRAPALATLSSGDVTIAWMEPADSPASDRNGGSIRARTFLAPSQAPASAARDSFTTSESTRLGGNVFADNGFGVDSSGAEVAAVNGSAAAVGRQITLASGALLTLNADGSFSYEPNGAFAPLVDPDSGAANGSATDSFTYSLVGGSSALVTVRITGNTAPGEPYLGSAGNDRLSGTGAADLFRLHQGGDDYAAGGAGDDVFWFGAKMNWLDQVSGGEGDDRVVLQGNYQTHFGTGSFFEVETLVLLSSQDGSFGGGSGSPQGLYSYKLSLLDAAVLTGRTLTLDASGLLADETLTLNASDVRVGTLVVRSGAGDDGITVGGGSDTIHGGAGNDALQGSGGNDSIFGDEGDDLLDGGSGADRLGGGPGDDVYVVDDGGDAVDERIGEGLDEVRTSLASYSLLGTNFEKLSATSDLAHVFRGSAEANGLSGGGGNDVLLLQDGGEDTGRGGGGNDVIYFGAAFSAGDVADGGAGRDALVLQGQVTAVLTDTNLVGIEAISIQSGANANFGDTANNRYDFSVTTADGNVAAGVQLIVNGQSLLAGEDLTFDGSAETDGKFLIYAGHGTDILKGGAGVDVFFFEGDRWGPDDRVDGGAGRDAVVISGGTGLKQVTFGANSLTNIESISVNATLASDPSAKPSYAFVLHNGNVTAGGNLILNANSIVDPAQTASFDGSAVMDGTLTMYGGAGNDTLIGGSGGDLLYGGLGKDSLIGNAGADIFQWRSSAEASTANPDAVLDFQGGVDKLDLHFIDADTLTPGDQAFRSIGTAAFTGGGAAGAGEMRVLNYNSFWMVEGDTNGDGAADFAITVVTQGNVPMLHTDFIL